MPGAGRPGSRKRERLSFSEASIWLVVIDNYDSSIIAGLLRSIPRRGGDLRISSPCFLCGSINPPRKAGGFWIHRYNPEVLPG